jgi:hypothetical protein
MAKRQLHPAMKARAAAVKQAHAHLTKTVPGFSRLHPHDRARMVHAHVDRAKQSGGY